MYCKKLKCFSYNILNTVFPTRQSTTMSVNPDLATLMRVIEDHQDKMPEGEYLAAMNALGALHRVAPAPPAYIPSGHPPGAGAGVALPVYGISANSENPNSYSNLIALMGQYGYNTWTRVTRMIPEHRQMTPIEWIELSQEEQNQLNRAAALKIVESYKIAYRNPAPSVCAFIARHAVGPWSYGHDHCAWTCVCGYHGKSKNWKKHEESDRHQDWAQHRIVPRRTVQTMKSRITKDEQGKVLYFNQPLTGGIRYFEVSQDRNEWTHPELYAGIHLEKNGNGDWFVHHRDDIQHHYVL